MKKHVWTLQLSILVILSTAGAGAALDAFTEEDVDTLLLIRPLIFGGSEIQAAIEQSTINGVQPPIFGYNAADRAILSWKIEDDMAAAFAQAIQLPPWMSLAKVSPITEELNPRKRRKGRSRHSSKSFLMLVDIANTERFVQGALVEWKTFVTIGADPVPRILRFDSQHAIPGVDLLDVFAPPFGSVEWGIEDGVASGLLTDGVHLLDISIPLGKGHGPKGKHRPERLNSKGKLKTDKHRALTEEFLKASEHVFSPLGSHSRYYYDGSSVSAELVSVRKSGISITNTFPWAAFVGELDSATLLAGKTEHLVQPIGIPVEQGSYESALFDQLTGMILSGANQEDVFGLLAQANASEKFPTLYYGVLHLYQALQIYSGQELPKMVFSLKRTPMAVFLNFEIPQEHVKAFREAFLPDHFELAKIRFYPEQKKAVYAVSLNVYEAVGQSVSGYRAEWSTYVINPNEEDPKPRFSVIEAQTSSFGLDPLTALDAVKNGQFDPGNLFTLLEGPAEVFEYSLDEENGLNIAVLDIAEDIEVDVSIAYPEEKDVLHTRPLKRWMEANDFVYWGEAADILKYDSNVMYADLLVFEAGPDDVVRDTAFSGYVNPEPLPIILWNGIQDIALEPWGNVQDIVTND